MDDKVWEKIDEKESELGRKLTEQETEKIWEEVENGEI